MIPNDKPWVRLDANLWCLEQKVDREVDALRRHINRVLVVGFLFLFASVFVFLSTIAHAEDCNPPEPIFSNGFEIQ